MRFRTFFRWSRKNAQFIRFSQKFRNPLILTAAATGVGIQSTPLSFVLCDSWKSPLPHDTPHPDLGARLPGLPTYAYAQVAKHKTKGESVWVTYKEGVYDVTGFVEKHPGGDKIMLGAGGPVDAFWRIYAQHVNLPHISHMMEEMRIGNLDAGEFKHPDATPADDPYRIDASIDRHPGLVFLTQRPANAELAPSLLCDSFLTPNELFFVRHHFPVPDPTAPDASTLTIGPTTLNVSELSKQFKQHEIVATIQCTGNRRTGYHTVTGAPGQVKGLPWGIGAISTAKWTGPLLRDVINHVYPKGIPAGVRHVCFTGRDSDGLGQHYGVSIQIERAMEGDVILALKMNDESLPLDHGAPIRVVVPGVAGCRSVKWLKSIDLSSTESTAFWQKEDYKSFSPSQGWEGLRFDSAPSVMATPVQSAICEVVVGDDKSHAVLKGYSFSGDGRGIIRVDVSADGGKTWTPAELQGEADEVTDLPYKKSYAWTLWTGVVDLPIHGDYTSAEFVVKAVDEGYNSQPESPAGIWNVRGILNNSWHRVKL